MHPPLPAAGAEVPERKKFPTKSGTNLSGGGRGHRDREFWLGHVALGRPSDRRRDAEFSTALPVDELRAKVEATRHRIAADLASLVAGQGTPSERRSVLPEGGSDESIVMHLVEECFQHVGQMEITADAFRARG